MQSRGIESSVLTYLWGSFEKAIWALAAIHSMTMKFLVCISKAPDTTSRIAFTEGDTQFDAAGVQFIVNPYDEWYALVRALELKEQHGGTVTTITVGEADCDPVIRKAWPLGQTMRCALMRIRKTRFTPRRSLPTTPSRAGTTSCCAERRPSTTTVRSWEAWWRRCSMRPTFLWPRRLTSMGARHRPSVKQAVGWRQLKRRFRWSSARPKAWRSNAFPTCGASWLRAASPECGPGRRWSPRDQRGEV